MISDDIRRNQLTILVNQLKNIYDEIDDICYDYDKMISDMHNNFMSDGSIIQEDVIKSDREQLENILKEISNGVIPRINNLL